MSEFAQRECRPLMEACTSAIYNTNSFRVLGVPVTATSRQIKRRMDELKMAVEMGDLVEEYTHALSPLPLPAMDDLRRAAKRLEDPQTRFVDEFFWFWPLSWEKASADQALQSLENDDRSAAETIWTEHLTGCQEVERLAATHNLAVLYHILAIGQEHDCHKNEIPRLPAELDQLNTLWRTSFDWWEKLVDHEGFWDLLRDRVLAINDPSLSTGFVLRFRSVFPVAFDNINADFAAMHLKNGKHSRAALHIQFMQETHNGLDDLDQSLSKVTRPLHSRIDAALNRSTENLHDNPKDGINRADRLLDETAEPLKALSTLLGADHTEVKETQDEVAEACCNCAIAYGNGTEEWASGVVLFEKLHGMVASEKLKSRIAQNLEILRTNAEHSALQATCWFCKKNRPTGGKERKVDVHITTGVTGRQTSWKHLGVPVPCCSSCKTKQTIIHPWITGALIGCVIGLFFATLESFGIGVGIGCVAGFMVSIKIKFIPPGCYKFPAVKKMLFQGWKKGEQPATVQGTPFLIPMNLPGFIFLNIVLMVGAGFLFDSMGGSETWTSSSSASSPSYSASRSSQPSYTSGGYSSSSSTRYKLGQEIDDEKARATRLGQDIEAADQEIESLERSMNSYKTWNVDEYNRLVPVFNQKVQDRNKIYEEYKRLINSVNTKVRKYNAM